MKEIRDIIDAFDKAKTQGKTSALATVVHVEGSSYRKEGARMLITEDGELTGAISGGCLEGDALRKALFVIQEKKPKLVVYDTSDEDDVEVGYQLGCDGIIKVLIEPINSEDTLHPISLLREAITNRNNAAVVTVFSLDPNTVQKGTCLLAKEENKILERVHDGNLLEQLLADVLLSLKNKKSILKNYGEKENEMSAFIQFIKPQPSLILVGAGNDAIPLVKMGELLGWKITVVDGRPNYASTKRFSSGCQVLVSKPEEIFSGIEIDEQTLFVLMTHNYNYDLAVLRELIHRNINYIGILGSRKKLSRMLDDLKSESVSVDTALSKIYSPVGLDIGAEAPEEIALSIISEIQVVLSRRTANHLRGSNRVHLPLPEGKKTSQA